MTDHRTGRHAQQHQDIEREQLLMEYASGTLNHAFQLLLSSYISYCKESRQFVSECEEIGGMMIEKITCSPNDMAATSLNNVLERIDALERCQKQAHLCRAAKRRQAFLQQIDTLPRPLARYIEKENLAPKWRRIRSGTLYYEIPTQDKTSHVMLMKIKPGGKAPAHAHHSHEVTLVLDGAVIDDDTVYQKGQIVIHEAGSSHAPVADRHAGCICLVATDGDTPLALTGRLMQLLGKLSR